MFQEKKTYLSMSHIPRHIKVNDSADKDQAE